jgi:hypothetical protein
MNLIINPIILTIKVYLNIPRVPTRVEMLMSLGTSSAHRIWRIKIALLSCDSEFLGNYLLPNTFFFWGGKFLIRITNEF